MKVGFTGTQYGMVLPQRAGFKRRIQRLFDSGKFYEFHHGLCIGSDTEAHDIVSEYQGVTIVGHPPMQRGKMEKRWCHVRWDPRPYLLRDEDIVLATDILVATPSTVTEVVRSGTWATVRRARKYHRPVVYVWPDGTSTMERNHA